MAESTKTDLEVQSDIFVSLTDSVLQMKMQLLQLAEESSEGSAANKGALAEMSSSMDRIETLVGMVRKETQGLKEDLQEATEEMMKLKEEVSNVQGGLVKALEVQKAELVMKNKELEVARVEQRKALAAQGESVSNCVIV